MRLQWKRTFASFLFLVMLPLTSQAGEIIQNFRPYETVPLTVSTSTAQVQFHLPQSAAYTDCLITNAGTSTAFIAFGKGVVNAQLPGTGGTENATPVLAGETLVLSKGNADTVAAITASGTTQLYFTSGSGN